ncbi:MAG: phosphotransferase, partial [Oscillospiraceae bacterium]|nr:phosphotransferase [Oscillospiraceae bacterium]
MQQAIHHFQIQSQPIFCKNFGHGNINYTFQITTDSDKQYILQRINTHVFKRPVELMENVIAVTKHIRSKVSGPNRVLNYVPALDGNYYYCDEAHRYWRCYEFVGGFCLEAPESDADFYESAVAFGQFQEQLADFPAKTLHETIPNFHNTPDRYRLLHIAMDEDACDRRQFVQKEIEFILEREQEACTIQRMLESDKLPLRVTHNDTKL